MTPFPTHLVARARQGDRRSFEQLYEEAAPLVHAVAISMLPPHDADDLVQEVFLLAWRRMNDLREPESFRPWLMSIARNRARNARTRKRAHDPLPDTLAADERQESRSDHLLGLLQQVPETYRETLAMRFIEDMSGPEIAAATGLTHGSVRVKLSRGLALLRERLEGRAGHE